ncbi:MAG: hypothetical protein JXA19_06900 [Anaerolineales bacterium]|nr:hypothetical protein [Anaerolineales bacterium]
MADLYSFLVYTRQTPFLGKISYYALKVLGVEVPISVRPGEGFYLVHGGFGVVIHPDTKIGEYVKIYPGVTLGRADIQVPIQDSRFGGIEVEDHVILSPGVKVLCKEGILKIGRGTLVGANAVLLESTGEYEIWAGIPAKKIGEIDRAYRY